MKLAKEGGAMTLVNPAPVSEISDEFYKLIDVITPNEVETAQYVGFEIDGEEAAKKAAEFFHGKGVKNVVLTLGSNGAFVSDGSRSEMIPAYKVKAIDTSGAGDTFNGALAYALDRGYDIFTSARFANAASSVAVQKRGAVKGNPTLEEVTPVFLLT
jgi:ribokinase